MYAILNKKVVTKSLLFEYVSHYNLPAGKTKTDLIETIVQLWKGRYPSGKPPDIEKDSAPVTQSQPSVVINFIHHTVNTTILQPPPAPSPLQIMSEEFSSWLCERINQSSLTESDLWKDVTSAIRLIDSQGDTQDLLSEGSQGVLQSLLDLCGAHQFKLAPNNCPTGVQGKMDSHGMVMIACCGTAYRDDQFVGVFEGGFGLLKDPDSADVWKLKHSKLQIRSATGGQTFVPQLENCESLQEILALPEPDEDQCKLIEYN